MSNPYRSCVGRGGDLKSLYTAQRLATAEEEDSKVDVSTLVTMKYKLPITEPMKKRRWIIAECPSYVEEDEI